MLKSRNYSVILQCEKISLLRRRSLGSSRKPLIGGGRLRDDPKERLCRRLTDNLQKLRIVTVFFYQFT